MTDYKATLNLPSTAFPMKANLAMREKTWLKAWQESKLYQCIREAKRGKPQFNLHDGPIYANGSIHLGHAVNRVLKDFTIRAKGLSGFDAAFIPGWDCHGLPIELRIEAKHVDALSADHSLFNSWCRTYAEQQIAQQKEAFRRLGLLGNWEEPYSTMDPVTVANTLRVLATVIDKGYMYPGFKPQYWCLDCQSALAEAEVEYHTKESIAVDVLFLCADPQKLGDLGVSSASLELPVFFVAWTTTPWTLFSNEALAVHPDHVYHLIRVENRLLIAAADRVAPLLAKHTHPAYELLATVDGSFLVGMTYAHPLLNSLKPVVASDHVTHEVGTGIVHIAPPHGLEDFQVGQQYNLPLESVITRSGKFTSSIPELDGQAIFSPTTTENILKKLKQNDRLWAVEQWSHSYPHCWRHKSPLVYLATPQWFIGIDRNQLRERALEAVNQVEWIPEWGATRIANMLRQRPDWCISRQRKWGVPLALFIHKETGELHPNSVPLLYAIADAIAEKGLSAWWDTPIETWITETEAYVRCTDILDVWFDSGATHTSVFQARMGSQPIDLYLEGSDQHRGWFMSSLLLGMICHQAAPYKTVLTHGYTVDQFGKKMSKSLGNVVEPMEIVNKYGSDVLRLWIASVDYRSEIVFSETLLNRVVDAYRRIRNTIRFLLANLNEYSKSKGRLEHDRLILLDQWILVHASETQDQLIREYEAYHFSRAAKRILDFCSLDLGSFYLDILKDRLYTTKLESMAYLSAQTTLFHLLHMLVRWISPILPFTAEEAWSYVPEKGCPFVAMTEWYNVGALGQLSAPFSQIDWMTLRQLRESVGVRLEQLRREKCIGSALDAELILEVLPAWFQKLLPYANELHFFFMTSKVTLKEYTLSADFAANNIGTFQVFPLKGEKCPRCWHRVSKLVAKDEKGKICVRCLENMVGSGEKRIFS